MDKVVIVTDSSAYLPKEYAEKYQIPVLPLTVNWNGKSYADGIDIEADEFYQQLAQSKNMATTSQVSVGQFLETFSFSKNKPTNQSPNEQSNGKTGNNQKHCQGRKGL